MSTLSNAISGLLAFQRALATTSHNISNVNTPGYTRQRVELDTGLPTAEGGYFIGNGVQITSIERLHDQFVMNEVLRRTTSAEQLDMFYQLSNQVSNLLADPNAGLAPAMQDFFNAMQDMADNPASIPARQVVLSQGNVLASRFNEMNDYLTQQRLGTNEQLQVMVRDINSYASAIADINGQISQYSGGAGTAPNDLLDRRDLMLNELSKLVSVDSMEQDNGSINVFIGSGQALVLGTHASQLATIPSEFDARIMEVAYVGSTTSTGVNITSFLSGGQMGGLIEFRDGLLTDTQNELGRIALGLSTMFNTQHISGIDLNSKTGENFFSDLSTTAAEVLPSRSNMGTAVVTAQIVDHSQLSNSDYLLQLNAGVYTLTRQSDSTVTTLGTFPPAQVVDGVNFAISSGAMADGDSILIRPTGVAADRMQVLLNDPSMIAAAAPMRSSTGLSNQGTAQISQGTVTDITNAAFATPGALTPEVTIRFIDAVTYEILDSSSMAVLETGIPYNAATGSDVFPSPGGLDYGYSLRITGTPVANDSFSIEYNAGGVGDNRNALALEDLQNLKQLVNNSATFMDVYGQLVGRVGAETREADMNSQTQHALLNQAIQRREEISGVNLDEEAANLVRYQQAYQAAAQVISISNSTFQTLIAAVGN